MKWKNSKFSDNFKKYLLQELIRTFFANVKKSQKRKARHSFERNKILVRKISTSEASVEIRRRKEIYSLNFTQKVVRIVMIREKKFCLIGKKEMSDLDRRLRKGPGEVNHLFNHLKNLFVQMCVSAKCVKCVQKYWEAYETHGTE